MTSNADLTPALKRPLLQALEKNDVVEKSVKQSADELMLVTAVLQTDIPSRAHSKDVAMALEKVDDINEVIQESAQELTTINEMLGEEIDERIRLERELLTTKAALASATDQKLDI